MPPASLILVVTGASGAGKTSAVRVLEGRARPHLQCHYFDSIGVPSEEVMARDFGGGDGWQAATTRQWLERIDRALQPGAVGVLDGQTRPSFVAAAAGAARARVVSVLLDCGPKARRKRLAARGQPELATPEMDCWAAYLRGQADALALPIINTGKLTVDEVADAIERQIAVLSAAAGADAQGADPDGGGT